MNRGKLLLSWKPPDSLQYTKKSPLCSIKNTFDQKTLEQYYYHMKRTILIACTTLCIVTFFSCTDKKEAPKQASEAPVVKEEKTETPAPTPVPTPAPVA